MIRSLREPAPRRWQVAPEHPQREKLARDARVDPLIAQLLLQRGVGDAAEARKFLAPEFRDLLPPERLANAVEAGRRLAAAARDGRRIVIYGDYDVDGVTATAILWHVLRLAGATVDTYVPCRFDEGYGLNAEALEQIAAAGGQVVVTVDCGVTASAEARRARELGLELIITDHHEPRGELPDAALIVHPTAVRPACPNPHLSGAGVALKVAWALAQELSRGSRVTDEFRDVLLGATTLAALGLIADVVPLTGENRIIASWGLRHARRSTNEGLRALIEVAGIAEKKSIDDYDVGFLLAPRLNAVGRMGHARDAVELFTTADAGRAREIAIHLDQRNRERQSVEREIVVQAEALVLERGMDRDGCRGIVLAHAEWHPGVIGIVASRLVERFCRPTVLIALKNGEGHGSGRSVRHFPLHEVLAACGEHLVSHGGHAMAAGVRIRHDRLESFTQAFQEQAANRLTAADMAPTLALDDEVDLRQMTPDVIEPLARMAPFGTGNPRPRLATGVVGLADGPRRVGANGAHLQFTVRQEETRAGEADNSHRKAIAFQAGLFADELAQQPRLKLAFEPIINEWNGRRSVELKIVDWQAAD